MGLSHLQGTSGYIGYFGSKEGKRTRYNCDHYERFAQCCFRNKKIQACKSPGRCKYHTENTAFTLLEIEKEYKLRVQKKQQQKNMNVKIKTGSTVEILNLVTYTRMRLTIVDPREVNRVENKISRTSMLGKNLMGHRADQIIEYRFDRKIERYKILNVE